MSTVQAIAEQARNQTADLPSWLNRDLRELVMAAAMYGWTIHIDSSGGGIGLRSYTGAKHIHLSQKKKSGPVARLRRDVWKYAHPDVKRLVNDDERTDYKSLLRYINTVEDATTVHEDTPKPKPPPRVQSTEPKPPAPPSVISEQPMVAKRTEGQGYPSPTTNERVWTDGHRDYTCRYEGCDFESENRLGPKNHWVVHKSPTGPPQDVYEVDVPDAAHYAPRKSRVEALADYLKKCFDRGEEPDWLVAAEEALKWVHTQSSQGTHLAGEREDLTAEEMLVRIRSLLDTGEAGRLVSENERLIGERVELVARLEAAEKEASDIREQWYALSELVHGVPEERRGA